MNDNAASPRTKALGYLDSARELVDLIGSFHEERRGLSMTDVDAVRGRELSQMIGEANGQLGFALKAADVMAQLDVADATREATRRADYRSGYDAADGGVITLGGERL